MTTDKVAEPTEVPACGQVPTRSGALASDNHAAGSVAPAPVQVPSRGEVRVTWALADGALVNVRSLPDGVQRRCTCVVCGQRLVPRRGRHRTWHFAHIDAEELCPLHGEDARRIFQAKMTLRDVLSRAGALNVQLTCTRQGRRERTHVDAPHEWASGWDDVKAGFRADSIEPGLVLRRDGQPIGGIEVRGATAVGPTRAQQLLDLGLPWLEVSADEVLRWDPAFPLPAYRSEPKGWTCPLCTIEAAHSKRRTNAAEEPLAEEAPIDPALPRRVLWEKEYDARHGSQMWRLRIRIIDVLDDLGIPTHRFLTGDHDSFIVAAVTAEELVQDARRAHDHFFQSRETWIASLRAVGMDVTECAKGWKTTALPHELYTENAGRETLGELLRMRREQPQMVQACMLLGVLPSAPPEVIAAARRGAAKKWHPDRADPASVTECTEKMKEINDAFDRLRTFRRRQKH